MADPIEVQYDEPFCERCGGEGIIEYVDGTDYCDCYAGYRRMEYDATSREAYKYE